MALYKFFVIGEAGPTKVIERQLPDDLDALEAARPLCRNHAVEVYADNRLVARVKQGDEPLNVKDARSG